jgi:hypothetical protein
MALNPFSKKTTGLFSFKDLPIQHRLPLLISLLLLCVIIAFASISYWGTKKTAMDLGGERLKAVTTQLSTILGQSAPVITTTTRNIASNEAIKKYFRNPGTGMDTTASALIQNCVLTVPGYRRSYSIIQQQLFSRLPCLENELMPIENN